MQIGDHITIIHGFNRVPGVVVDLEIYRKAYLIIYRSIASQGQALAVAFPDYQYLPPPPPYEHPELFHYSAYIEWEDHYWPVAAGQQSALKKTNLIATKIDPRQLGRNRVDYVLDLIARTHGLTDDFVIHPQDDREHKEWQKWKG